MSTSLLLQDFQYYLQLASDLFNSKEKELVEEFDEEPTESDMYKIYDEIRVYL